MKFAVALSFVTLAVGSVLEGRQNNCDRALTGSRYASSDLAARSTDCSKFLATTVTPAPTTVTVTVDDAATTPAKRFVLEARQVTVTPAVVPTYITSACANFGEYSAACSKAGVTGTVTTAPTPTVTVTTTIDYCDDL